MADAAVSTWTAGGKFVFDRDLVRKDVTPEDQLDTLTKRMQLDVAIGARGLAEAGALATAEIQLHFAEIRTALADPAIIKPLQDAMALLRDGLVNRPGATQSPKP